MIAEEIVDMETIEEVDYGETGFLDGISSTQETKNSVGLVIVSKSSRVKILHRRLRRIPLMVGIR